VIAARTLTISCSEYRTRLARLLPLTAASAVDEFTGSAELSELFFSTFVRTLKIGTRPLPGKGTALNWVEVGPCHASFAV
jgi:hypothetical protein